MHDDNQCCCSIWRGGRELLNIFTVRCAIRQKDSNIARQSVPERAPLLSIIDFYDVIF